ncbi:MAG: ABC-2 type transport system permease protein [Candidatus Poriferisodalaceae bacterium]
MVESTEPVGHLHIHARMIAARISSDWQYRTSFFTFAAAQALITALELLAIVLLFQLVPDIGGWTGGEVAFLYVLAALSFALADLTVSAVERVSVYIQSGDFDRVLLRPIPALLQLSSLEFELRRVGKVVPAVGVLIWALFNVDVSWTVGNVLYLAATLLFGTAI